MSTLWANGDRGLKSTLGQQSSEQYSLTSWKIVYPDQPSSSRKNSLNRHFFTFCFIPGDQMSTLWANGDSGLKSTLCQQSSGQQLFNLTEKSLPRPTFILKKKFTKSAFFHLLLHSRWSNVHFMGKWRQGLKIDLVPTKQRTAIFNLTEEVYPVQPSSSRKNSPSQHFFSQFCFIPGEQMSTLWANGDRGLKSTLCQQSSGQSIFNLTEEVYPVQPSSSRKNSPNQHFFTILLHSRWTNVHFMGKWRQGLKIDLGATKQRTVLFNLRKKCLPRPTFIFKKKFTKSAFFHLLLHSRRSNVHFMGKWRQGLKIDLVPTKQRTAIFNLTEEVYPVQPSSSRKNSPSQHFFTILLHSRWTNVHFMGKWRQGLKIDLGPRSSGPYSLTSHKKFTQPNHPLPEKIR